MSAQFNTHTHTYTHTHTHTVCKRRTAKSRSLSFSLSLSLPLSFICLPSCFLCLVLATLHTPPIPQTTHTHSHSAPFLLFCRETCRLEEEGREDEVAWEGLSPNRSICFLVCPPGWLLAPDQLLHSPQPDAKHKHMHTTGQHTPNPQH